MKNLKNFILVVSLIFNVIALVCFLTSRKSFVSRNDADIDKTENRDTNLFAMVCPELSMKDSCTLNVDDYKESGDFVPFGKPDTTSVNSFCASVRHTDSIIGKIYDKHFRNRNIPLEQKIDSMMRRRGLWAEALSAIWSEMGTAVSIHTDIVRYKISKIYYQRLANCEGEYTREKTWNHIIEYYRFDPYFQEVARSMMSMSQWTVASGSMVYLNYSYIEEQIEVCWYELITECQDIPKQVNDKNKYMSKNDLYDIIPFSHEEMDFMENRGTYLEAYDLCRKNVDILDRQLDNWCPPKECCKRLVQTLKKCL